MKRATTAALVAVCFLEARPAAACAVCALEDPTLSPAGSERPFRGRLRADLDALAGWVEEGAADDRWLRVDDARLAVSLVYGPSRDVLVSALVPVMMRALHDGGTTTASTVLGDMEGRVHAVLSRSEGSGSSELALVGGMKAPTAPVQHDARGAPLPAELQPGCSAIVPYLGLVYGTGGRWITAEASATMYLPFAVRDAPHAGDSFRAAAWMQLQPAGWIATRFGARAQVDSTGELSPNVTDLNSGGVIGYVTTDAIVSPWTDVVLAVGASFPVAQALLGEQRKSAIVEGRIAFDF